VLGHGGDELADEARPGCAAGRGVVGRQRGGAAHEHQPVHRAQEPQRQRGGERIVGVRAEDLAAHPALGHVGNHPAEHVRVEL
jgi:hypothetical protein